MFRKFALNYTEQNESHTGCFINMLPSRRNHLFIIILLLSLLLATLFEHIYYRNHWYIVRSGPKLKKNKIIIALTDEGLLYYQ